MVVSMSGSPSPTSSPNSPNSTGYTGFRSNRSMSPPTTKKEAEQNIGWLSVGRPHVLTKADNYLESEKQYFEKEINRQRLLDKEAYEMQLKTEAQAKEREIWLNRQRAREMKEKYEKEFKANERKVALAEWKETAAQEPGHGPTRWLWPTARDHPRMLIAGTDIPIKDADREKSTIWQSSPGARAKVMHAPALYLVPGE